MRKQLSFMVVDTETATLPFANELAQGDPERKKKIAIAKPLIYDIGWTITNRKGEVLDRKQFLVAETFAVPQIFNTAYYAEKRPIYLDMLKAGKTSIKPWDEIIEIFLTDARQVDAIGAFNSMFDFKKAIPFTELYIRKLYSPDYYKWEAQQRKFCEYILTNAPDKKDKEFDLDNFKIRGEEFPLFDLWGLATTYLLNNVSYKNECLKHGLLTNSGTFFKTSAESTYQYLCNKYDFVESHTALDDALIETYILSQVAKRSAIKTGIKYFPFRDLGSTDDFVQRTKIPRLVECEIVYKAISKYVDDKLEMCQESAYLTGVINRLKKLANYMNIECLY